MFLYLGIVQYLGVQIRFQEIYLFIYLFIYFIDLSLALISGTIKILLGNLSKVLHNRAISELTAAIDALYREQ